MKRWIAALMLGMLAAATSSAVEIEGYNLPETTVVAGQNLTLNGAGVRTRAIFKVYVAGLYLPRKAAEPKDVISQKGAKRMALIMLRDLSSKEFGDAFLKGIRENAAKEEIQKQAMALIQLGSVFGTLPGLKKGDLVNIDSVPGKGMLINVNGKTVGEVTDEEFYPILLKIWFGDKPVDSMLKPLLLGQKPVENRREPN
ncbi:MAG: chalcone isomerase family protein [Burkholderiaceae bacterium]